MAEGGAVFKFITKALILLELVLQSKDDMYIDRVYMLMFAGCIFMVLGFVDTNQWKWGVAGFMTFLLVLVIYTVDHRYARTKNDDKDESINETSFWKHAYRDAWSLSGDVNILDTNLIDQFAAHGIISLKRRDDIVDRLMGMEKPSSNDIPKNATPRNIHFYLLSRDFRKTGDKEYKIYCDILLQRPKFEHIGLQLCRLCGPSEWKYVGEWLVFF